MLIENIEINLDTNKTFEIIDITSKINEIIANSNMSNGIVNIFSKHSLGDFDAVGSGNHYFSQ